MVFTDMIACLAGLPTHASLCFLGLPWRSHLAPTSNTVIPSRQLRPVKPTNQIGFKFGRLACLPPEGYP